MPGYGRARAVLIELAVGCVTPPPAQANHTDSPGKPGTTAGRSTPLFHPAAAVVLGSFGASLDTQGTPP